jgi:hypothetical protein
MATEILPINSADVVRVAPVVRAALVVSEDPVEPVVRAALVVSEGPVEPVVRAALVVSEDPVEPAVRAALVVPEDLGEPVVPEDLEEPAARAALVVSESPAVPVALVVPVAVERELVRGAAVLARGHPRARLAVALRIRLVIAAHRPDLVPLLEAGEDLAAAVAETTREPAVAEAVIAWEAAVTAAAAEEEDIAVAEDAAAEEGAEDKRRIDGEKTYEDKTKHHDFVENDRARNSGPHNRFLCASLRRSAGEEGNGREARRRQGNSATGAKAIRHAETGSRRPYSGSG